MLKSAVVGHDRLAEGVGGPRQCKAYIATTKRNLATLEKFKAAAINAGLQIKDITSMALLNSVHFHYHGTLQTQRANIILHEVSVPDSSLKHKCLQVKDAAVVGTAEVPA